MNSLDQQIDKKIKAQQLEWGREIKQRYYKLESDSAKKDINQEELLQEIVTHLTYLAETILIASPSLFVDYISWKQILLNNLERETGNMDLVLEAIKQVMVEKFADPELKVITKHLEAGSEALNQKQEKVPSYLTEEKPHFELATDYLDSLLNDSRQESSQLILSAVEEGVSVKEVYLYVFQPVQREIGRLWQLNRLSIAQEHYCTSVTQLIMSQLYPYILNERSNSYSCVTTCVGEELHELGIRMIADLLEMEGWDTIHLGANTPLEGIVDTIQEEQADLLAVSVTMTSHLTETIDLIDRVNHSQAGQAVKTMVGGYPFNANPQLWQKIGADGHAQDLDSALDLANKLCKEE